MNKLSLTDTLAMKDEEADRIIKGWTFGSLVGNLLPPPFDSIVVAGAFARMGQAIGKVYGVPVDFKLLKDMGGSMAKGVGTVAGASYIGSGIFKWIPGVNIWVALLVQPPLVAAIAFSVGNAFKKFYRIRILEGRDLTPAEIREIAEGYLAKKLQ